MSRIIMLIPIDQNVSLTTISLSLISFLHENKCEKKSHKSILFFSCIHNSLDDTKLIINKYFSKFIDILDDLDFSKDFFLSHKYPFLLNQVIEKCYSKKQLYEFIIIEGINYNYSIYAEQINYDIAQNVSAEVIFLANLKNSSLQCLQKKEKKIQLFLNKKKYKNVLGLIFNNINSPFIEKKYNFFEKMIVLKNTKNELFIEKKVFNNIIPIIAFIPWNKKIIKIHTIDIYKFLDVHFLDSLKNPFFTVEKIIIFDPLNTNMLDKKYLKSLILVPLNQINILINIFNLNITSNHVSGIILTEVSESKEYIFSICSILIRRGISIVFTKKNAIEILSQLADFNFNINLKDRMYIEKLQKYITSFFFYNSIFFSYKRNYNFVKYSPKEFFYYLKFLSKQAKRRIILPESYEIRILKAVYICQKNDIADCVLLGDAQKIYRIASDNGIYLNRKIEIINPIVVKNKYVNRLIEIRKRKGMNEDSAKKQLQDHIVLATLILESNEVDGLVSGSVNTTANTIRPALQLIKTSPNNSLVSSIFFMLLPNQVLIYADCAININPTAEELAEIAIQSADSAKIFGIEPRIAMLSYSTGDSGFGYPVEKVKKATFIVKNKRPDLIIDGPIQYDTAISETVSKLKAPYSPILGTATVFIFPDLNSGNIAYKAVQRSANIVSIGPILQGLRKPVNDLSRGASVEDIVYTIASTAIQSL